MNIPSCQTAAIKSGLSKIEINKLLNIAKDVAKIGGESLMNNYGKIKTIECKGTAGDLVTNADIECERLIIEYLEKKTPNISILAEESGYKSKDGEFKWCVDPLDGTTNYAHGYPFFATSIGLIWNNNPILGAISVPSLNEIYYASPEHGAFCNGKKISVTKTNSLSESLLVTGFAYDRRELIDNNYSEFCRLTHLTHGVRRGGAAAVDLAFVASGKVDGFWERGLAKWDMAAGVPLVEMAGGIVSNYPRGDFNLDNGRILACNTEIKDELINELEKIKPLTPDSYGGN
tara:strand:- start:1633 stop:2499 length:867 start_codon:yes stop_codon:yes gene_type:complete